jgi:acetyltransferase-like isoleucine patch superfamily enzyme
MHAIAVPRLNANEDELLVTGIFVSVGDHVRRDQELFSVESTKANHDVLSDVDGFVRRIAVEQGDWVAVGAACILISDARDEPLSGLGAPDSPLEAPEQVEAASPRGRAKDRLEARRVVRGQSGGATEPGRVDRADSPGPSDALGWVQEMRIALRSRCGETDNWPLREFSSGTCSGEGVFVESGVQWGEHTRIFARRLFVGRNARLGRDVVLKADSIYVGQESRISDHCSLVTGELLIEDGVLLAPGVTCDLSGGQTPDSRLIIGSASLVGGEVFLNTAREILIERECAISPRAMLFTHSFWPNMLEGYRPSFRGIRLCQAAWIGAGCQVLPGVIIDAGAVVISNSTVTENVPAHCLAGGVPAKVLRKDIRHESSDHEKVGLLVQFLESLAEALRFKSCAVELSDNGRSLVVSRVDFPARRIRLVTPDAVGGSDEDICLSLGVEIEPAQRGSLFDLDRRHFSGVEDRLTHEVRNALRRRGIRLTPYAWNADYTRGF